MRNQINKELGNNANENVRHQVVVEGGGEKYGLKIEELASFLDQIELLEIKDLKELNINLEIIADYAMDGAPEDLPISSVKNKLKLMRELIFLFNAFLYKID